MRIAWVLAVVLGAAGHAWGQVPSRPHGVGPKASSDTSRPAVPSLPNLPADSTFTVELPNTPRADGLYYSNIIGIIFDDTTSGVTIKGVLARYSARIIGGLPGDQEYIVRLLKPRPTFAATDSLVTRLRAEPGVALARMVNYHWKPMIDSRPQD